MKLHTKILDILLNRKRLTSEERAIIERAYQFSLKNEPNAVLISTGEWRRMASEIPESLMTIIYNQGNEIHDYSKEDQVFFYSRIDSIRNKYAGLKYLNDSDFGEPVKSIIQCMLSEPERWKVTITKPSEKRWGQEPTVTIEDLKDGEEFHIENTGCTNHRWLTRIECVCLAKTANYVKKLENEKKNNTQRQKMIDKYCVES